MDKSKATDDLASLDQHPTQIFLVLLISDKKLASYFQVI
jgi:hypothetical protein